jgi:nucleoside-diphosphate-sugar epimerase
MTGNGTSLIEQNSPERVLVTGATGFVGGRLCEVTALTGVINSRAFVHSTGSAWRIARLPLDFVMGDLCDRKSVRAAVSGCNAIVHLALGSRAAMRKGLDNILQAAVDYGISRFVHVSSVAIYGNHPPPESASEVAVPTRTNLEYGNMKLEQEHRVMKYRKRYGLPVVILRPPNIYGPFSHFTMDVLKKIRAGTLPIVDGGLNPCNLVYIDNLVEAILLALRKPEAVGETFFVTDGEVITWGDCLRDYAKLLGLDVPYVTAGELMQKQRERVVRQSFRVLPRVFLGKEMRDVLRKIPVVKLVELAAYGWFESLPDEAKQRIRLWLRGPVVIKQNGSPRHWFDAEDNRIAAQARAVAHSNEKARRLLGYSSPISYKEGMSMTEAWLRYARLI